MQETTQFFQEEKNIPTCSALLKFTPTWNRLYQTCKGCLYLPFQQVVLLLCSGSWLGMPCLSLLLWKCHAARRFSHNSTYRRHYQTETTGYNQGKAVTQGLRSTILLLLYSLDRQQGVLNVDCPLVLTQTAAMQESLSCTGISSLFLG